ncbi:MAG: biopolymer transporter ExbD [Alphaproteobacteria bacterium]|nr:biopolymer transporter ExbD [Alphaproteobacteria bacterium]
MAGSIGGTKSRGQRYDDNSQINVTPFVDVMLVLLIIFMVAAPLASVNVKVELPPSVSKPAKVKDPVYVSLQANGKIYIGDIQVSYSEFSTRLVSASGNNYNRRIFIRADKTVQYKEVMRVMNVIQDTGFYQIALVAEDRVTN